MRKFGFDNEYGTTFDYGIRFLEFPDFQYGQEVIDMISVTGRAGTLTVRTGRYTDTVITNVLEFESDSLQLFEEKLRMIKKWIFKTKKLRYTDKEDKFFIVKKVEVDKEQRQYGLYGHLTVIFTCEPAAYLVAGSMAIDLPKSLYNPLSWSQPVYIIKGQGKCMLTVNGKSVQANVDQNITIDTGRMIAYKNDAVLQNTAIAGNYEDLYLREGDNQMSISDGFECKIIPNWRCL